MILAVLLIIVTIVLVGWPSTTYLLFQLRQRPLETWRMALMAASCTAAVVIAAATCVIGMRSGVRALEAMRN